MKPFTTTWLTIASFGLACFSFGTSIGALAWAATR